MNPGSPQSPPGSPCERCEGAGWVLVSPSGVEARLGPDPVAPPDATEETYAAWEEAVRLHRAKRAAMCNTAYPCKDCNKGMFYRWANGHLDKDHDRGTCEECSAVSPRRKRRSYAGAAGHRDF